MRRLGNKTYRCYFTTVPPFHSAAVAAGATAVLLVASAGVGCSHRPTTSAQDNPYRSSGLCRYETVRGASRSNQDLQHCIRLPPPFPQIFGAAHFDWHESPSAILALTVRYSESENRPVRRNLNHVFPLDATWKLTTGGDRPAIVRVPFHTKLYSSSPWIMDIGVSGSQKSLQLPKIQNLHKLHVQAMRAWRLGLGALCLNLFYRLGDVAVLGPLLPPFTGFDWLSSTCSTKTFLLGRLMISSSAASGC